MTVNKGDKVEGHLTCAPNARNNRDLDITLAYKSSSEIQESVVHYKMFVLSSFLAAPPFPAFEERTLISCQVLIIFIVVDFDGFITVIFIYLFLNPHNTISKIAMFHHTSIFNNGF